MRPSDTFTHTQPQSQVVRPEVKQDIYIGVEWLDTQDEALESFLNHLLIRKYQPATRIVSVMYRGDNGNFTQYQVVYEHK